MGGEQIPISSVKIGDYVLSATKYGNLSFAEVIAVPHGPNSIHTTFVHLITELADIHVTADHLIFAAYDKPSSHVLIPAGDVKLGYYLLTKRGYSKVVSIELRPGQGVYTVVTTEAYVVINGIVASPFSLNHFTANAFYDVLRMVHQVLPQLLKSQIFQRALRVFGDIVMSGEF
jgi:hypothetical protein